MDSEPTIWTDLSKEEIIRLKDRTIDRLLVVIADLEKELKEAADAD